MLVNRALGAGISAGRHSWYGDSRHCHSRRSRTVQAAFEGCQQPLPNPVKVVGLGSAGIDYLASIAAFPRPDDKLRTDKLEVQGGGNCGNALTAAARLGLSPFIVTKIGDDSMGDAIISEFEEDGVDTSCVVRAEGHPSPFTYIIVDRAGGTRTCIHTPGAPMVPDELTNDHISTLLEGAALVYFDGRLTEVALKLAQAAKARNVPVLVEAERLRPGLELLLDEADYVFTSAHFPQAWTGEAKLADALITMVSRLPHAKLFITTRGTQGSIMLNRAPHGSVRPDMPQQSLDDLMTNLTNQLRAKSMPASANASISSASTRAASAPDCMSSSGIPIHKPLVAHSSGPVRLRYSAGRSAAAAQAAVVAAASRAASQNADAANASRYGPAASSSSGERRSSEVVVAGVVLCQACALAKSDVADTTGAGDSFMGSVIYGLVTGMSHERMLQLASVVAACKCTELGPRPGLPRRVNLRADLLQ